MSEIAIKRDTPDLGLGDRVRILKHKASFSFVFSVLVLLLIVVFFGIVTDGAFFGKNIIVGIFNQALIVGTMATAASFIYTAGNLDISVGSVMALSALVGVLVHNATGSIALLVVVPIVMGVILMALNCTFHVLFGIRTIIVAIVMMQLYNAVVQKVLGPETLKIDYDLSRILENAGFRYVAFILYFALCLILFHLTPIGRKLRFVGGNAKCAEQTGMSRKLLTYVSFAVAGIGVGLSALFTVIRTSAVTLNTGSGLGMDVMLATVLGGMSIFGGAKSNAYAGILGALTVSALNKGLLMYGVSPMVIQGVRGAIFLLLVFMNSERPESLPSMEQ